MALELTLLLVLLPLARLLRVLRLAGWPIEVRREGRIVHAESVHGWRASTAGIRALGDAIGRGDPPGASPAS